MTVDSKPKLGEADGRKMSAGEEAAERESRLSGSDVGELQLALRSIGFRILDPVGEFGADTTFAVSAFQGAMAHEPDGRGSLELQRLAAAVAKTLQGIRTPLALEWLDPTGRRRGMATLLTPERAVTVVSSGEMALASPFWANAVGAGFADSVGGGMVLVDLRGKPDDRSLTANAAIATRDPARHDIWRSVCFPPDGAFFVRSGRVTSVDERSGVVRVESTGCPLLVRVRTPAHRPRGVIRPAQDGGPAARQSSGVTVGRCDRVRSPVAATSSVRRNCQKMQNRRWGVDGNRARIRVANALTPGCHLDLRWGGPRPRGVGRGRMRR
jgi:peptidoglycan hydrolase-like protein with peptidoglycan-binding domain